jgi:hypothetical protein
MKMPEHEERAPTTLAHGAVKSSDIERVRENVANAEKHQALMQNFSAAPRWRRIVPREVQRKPKASSWSSDRPSDS